MYSFIVVRQPDLAGEGDQRPDPGIALPGHVVLERLAVFHRALPGRRDDHGLGRAAQLLHDRCPEVLHDDLHPLGDIGVVQLHEPGDLPLGGVRLAARVLLDLLVDPVERLVLRIVLEHVQDEALLDGLLHGIDVARLPLALGIQATEEMDGRRLRRGREREHGHVRLLSVALDLVRDHVLHVRFGYFPGAEGHRDGGHVLARRGGMGLVDDDREPLGLQVLHAVHDERELLDGGGDDLRVPVQGNREVGGIALVVHHADQAGLVLHAHDGLLELTVHDHAVRHDDYVVEDDPVVRVVQAGQPVGQPRDGIGLAGTGAVLDQVVQGRAVLADAGQ